MSKGYVLTRHRLLVLAVLASLAAVVAPAPAGATPAWAPSTSATIRPGAATLTGGSLCTSNFVFHDPAGDVYLGQAAHCSSDADVRSLDGCVNGSLPLGTPVRVAGASRPGRLVYNSWLAMQQRRETNLDACFFNDFALVQLDPADRSSVNPTIPVWGGPTGMVPTSFSGADVLGYGTSINPAGVTSHAKRGVSLRQAAGGWVHIVDMDPPGIAGDSGSGLIDGQGRAFGVISTMSIRRGTNAAGDLSRMLDYAKGSGFPELMLAHGESFTGAPPAQSQDPVGDLLRDLLNGLLNPGG